uniref:ATP synthase F0 subunit 8 n=1 Tax=Nierstraszella lineata TaxID=515354 RepID=A0A6H1PGQ0_9MOLL|nr:ATP synthase F0 subunit 8 [Nierstraszella lineata]QIZ12572.1 ATP synthase F0 subunit 8 [Nierstraszella lineata]
MPQLAPLNWLFLSTMMFLMLMPLMIFLWWSSTSLYFLPQQFKTLFFYQWKWL